MSKIETISDLLAARKLQNSFYGKSCVQCVDTGLYEDYIKYKKENGILYIAKGYGKNGD